MHAATQLTRLAAQGVIHRAAAAATRELLEGWRQQGVTRGRMLHRLAAVQLAVDRGVVATEEFCSSAEDVQSRRLAVSQLDALLAMRREVTAALVELKFAI